MKRIVNIIVLLLLVSTIGFAQTEPPKSTKTQFFIRGGVGTSWIIMPKVFLIDESDPDNNWRILPTTNAFTGYVGLQTVIPLNGHWLFTPELDFNYISGEIRVDELKTGNASQKLQSYIRIEVPINFAIISSDNFWVSFGPVVFFTLSDNKGFEDAVFELTDQVTLNSDNPLGLRFRLATYIILERGRYIDIKFDSDLNRDFYFKDGIYNMKMSMQSITVGFGFSTNRDR